MQVYCTHNGEARHIGLQKVDFSKTDFTDLWKNTFSKYFKNAISNDFPKCLRKAYGITVKVLSKYFLKISYLVISK